MSYISFNQYILFRMHMNNKTCWTTYSKINKIQKKGYTKYVSSTVNCL